MALIAPLLITASPSCVLLQLLFLVSQSSLPVPWLFLNFDCLKSFRYVELGCFSFTDSAVLTRILVYTPPRYSPPHSFQELISFHGKMGTPSLNHSIKFAPTPDTPSLQSSSVPLTSLFHANCSHTSLSIHF